MPILMTALAAGLALVPLVLAMGGIHGNEPSGTMAIQRVLRALFAWIVVAIFA